MITVRQATALDLLHIAPLVHLYGSEAKGHDNFPVNVNWCMKNVLATITSEEGSLLLAFNDSELVGVLWGHCYPLPWSLEQLASDCILYVRPEHRKSKVGYELMLEWEQWAKEKGAAEVQISVASGIHEGRTLCFYNEMGYRYIGQQLRKEL